MGACEPDAAHATCLGRPRPILRQHEGEPNIEPRAGRQHPQSVDRHALMHVFRVRGGPPGASSTGCPRLCGPRGRGRSLCSPEFALLLSMHDRWPAALPGTATRPRRLGAWPVDPHSTRRSGVASCPVPPCGRQSWTPSRCLGALGGLGLTGAPSSKLPSGPESHLAQRRLSFAASVWGSGTGGYARRRTLRVFDHDAAEVGDRLAVAAQLLRADGR